MNRPGKYYSKTKLVLIYFVLLSIGVYFAFPFCFMFFGSFKTQSEIFTSHPAFLPQDGWKVENYERLFYRTNFPRGFLNSVIVSFFAVTLPVFFCALGGYAFAKYKFPGKRAAFIFMLLTMMIPQGVMLIPLFEIMSKLGWINTYLPLIIPGLANAFGIFFMRQYSDNVPDSLLDAAKIDGCSDFGIFCRIVLPLLKPGLMVLGFLFFIGTWNDFMWPLIVLNKEKMYTIPIILASFSGPEGERFIEFGGVLAGSVIGAAPVIIVFLILQKQFISGIMAGSVKE